MRLLLKKITLQLTVSQLFIFHVNMLCYYRLVKSSSQMYVMLHHIFLIYHSFFFFLFFNIKLYDDIQMYFWKCQD